MLFGRTRKKHLRLITSVGPTYDKTRAGRRGGENVSCQCRRHFAYSSMSNCTIFTPNNNYLPDDQPSTTNHWCKRLRRRTYEIRFTADRRTYVFGKYAVAFAYVFNSVWHTATKSPAYDLLQVSVLCCIVNIHTRHYLLAITSARVVGSSDYILQ